MTQSDKFDEVLDRSLSEYRDLEPLAGFEDRILRRVKKPAVRRRRTWQWLLAPSAALLVLMVWLGFHDRPFRRIQAQQAQQYNPAAVPNVTAPGPDSPSVITASRLSTTARAHSSRIARRRLRDRALYAKGADVPGEFPIPEPSNREERAFLTLLQAHPSLIAQLDHDDSDDAIAILPISINPLSKNEGVSQGEN